MQPIIQSHPIATRRIRAATHPELDRQSATHPSSELSTVRRVTQSPHASLKCNTPSEPHHHEDIRGACIRNCRYPGSRRLPQYLMAHIRASRNDDTQHGLTDWTLTTRQGHRMLENLFIPALELLLSNFFYHNSLYYYVKFVE